MLAERLQFTVEQGPCLAAHEQDHSVMGTGQSMAAALEDLSCQVTG